MFNISSVVVQQGPAIWYHCKSLERKVPQEMKFFVSKIQHVSLYEAEKGKMAAGNELVFVLRRN